MAEQRIDEDDIKDSPQYKERDEPRDEPGTVKSEEEIAKREAKEAKKDDAKK